jgi:ABC-2 type transport system ATP-binding protein
LKPRQLQAALASAGGIVDATLEGKRVRVVTSSDEAPESALFEGLTLNPVTPRFEDGFMILVRRAAEHSLEAPFVPFGSSRPPEDLRKEEVVVEVHNLTMKFGTFTAVDNATFKVHRGQIFGLLGPNGAGKSTTFRMLCGLLPASSGTLSVAGMDLLHARASARQRIGYVAQKFSLYGQLTVMENLKFFTGAYGLRGSHRSERIDWALDQFDLRSQSDLASGQLPGGYKQRLAMACALIHEPEILFLDEPTSGVDPLARREFWRRINTLADRGVTVIVTTHFLEEAEYCDHMVIMVDGQILATGTPADIRGHARYQEGKEPSMEDAFVAIVEDHRMSAVNREQ